MLDFWHSVDGIMEVELTSAEPEAAFGIISKERIEVQYVHTINELTCSFRISRKDYHRLEEICKKRGDVLKIRRKQGLYWGIRGVLKRRFLIGGCILFLAMVLWMPSRVFFVCVEGNERIPDRKILEAAESCGIRFGASRREVRSEKIKNELLEAVPDLQWAGVNTSGCTATISVRERSVPEAHEENLSIASIAASRDGYILSCTVTRGNMLVKPGISVKEGQTLISAYTDCGLCIRAEQAEGEIFAQTSRIMEAVFPIRCLKIEAQKEVKRKYSLLLGKKRINLWKDSGIWDASCGRMYEEYYVSLPGGFQLPFALCVEEYVCYETSEMEIADSEAGDMLKLFSDRYIMQNMVAGKIVSAVQTILPGNGVYRLKGSYICEEMIGRVRQEQIGETNGKNG